MASWLDYIVPGLRERGWRVTLGLVQGRFHDVDAYLQIHPDDQVVRISCGTGTSEGRARELVKALRLASPDIVVSVNVVDVLPAVDRMRAQSNRSPHVAVALHALQADFISSIERWADVVDAVVCTNRLTCGMVLRGSSVEPDRVYYAPYGVDTPMLISNERRDANAPLSIAYVGRLERGQKRIQDLAAIVANLEKRAIPYRLFIAGAGPDEEWLRRELAESIRAGNVTFLGSLSGEELSTQIYSRVDAVLITSFWETGPIVAWEAMSHGVPLVTSTYVGSGLENALKNEDNCLMFPIGDASEAARCLQKLRDPCLKERLVRGGLDLITRRYSKAVSIAHWDACLRQICARPPPPVLYKSTGQAPPAGRLDRLLGVGVGESIRELLKRRHQHESPGGEWPHAYRDGSVDEDEFWTIAMSLDHRARSTNLKENPSDSTQKP